MLRIAIITERADIALGGAERSVSDLAWALLALGLDVHIIAAKGNANSSNMHILCKDTPGKRTSHYTFANALKNHLADHDYDIIHSVLPFDFVDVYQPRGGAYAEAALRNAASYRHRFVRCFKTLTCLANLRRSTLLRAERKLCRSATGPVIAALSNYVGEQFKRHYRTPPQRITVIPNGVRTDRHIDHQRAQRLRSQILSKLAVREANNPVLFLFAAHNFRLKGLHCLIQATALAIRTNPDLPIYLVIAGSGQPHPYLTAASAHGISNRLVFLGAVNNVQDLFSITNVAVLPTFYDPSSRFILEALAAGKPVITTRYNGAIDLFTDNRHGLVLDEPNDIAALAKALTHFGNPTTMRQASQAILEDNLADRVSINRAAQQLLGLYESLLNRKDSHRCTHTSHC
jgi:UDP-glucose:(heptosyl)LPS alpha-1,3-glucosyltransferase